LGGAGLLIGEKRFAEIGGLIKLLAEDRAFRRAIIRKKRERIRDFHAARITSQLSKALQEMGIDPADGVSRGVMRHEWSQAMPDPSPLTTQPSSITPPALS